MDEASAGRFGADATVEVDPRTVGSMRLAYSPHLDGSADPGEIVWTWVPYEERDGRGKDRPVLVVASEPGGGVLGVALTSKPHDDRWDVGIGSGPWDAAGRPSWVRLERVFRLQQSGVRRAGVGLDAPRFATVAAALAERYGWPAPTGLGARGPAPAGGSKADARPGARTPTGARARSGSARHPAPTASRPAQERAATPGGTPGVGLAATLSRALRTLFPPRR